MGQGLNSCHNLNNWAHLFNPNSPAALQGEIACDMYWGRSSSSVSANHERGSRSKLVAYANGATTSIDQEAKRRTMRFFVVIALVLVAVYYFSK